MSTCHHSHCVPHLKVVLLDHLLEEDPLGAVAAHHKVHEELAGGAEPAAADLGERERGHKRIYILTPDHKTILK